MKKKIIITIIFSAVIIISVLLIANSLGLFYRASEQEIRFMTEINEANSIIMYYGNPDPGKEITINYREVTEFTDETIGDSDNQYVYHAIVIFDFDGEMDISNEELLLIKDYCENKNYDLLYYGTAHLNQFQKNGFFTQLDSTENCGFVYNGSYWVNRSGQEECLNPYLLTGNWTKSDDDLYDTSDQHKMWKFVVGFIVDLLNDSMGES